MLLKQVKICACNSREPRTGPGCGSEGVGRLGVSMEVWSFELGLPSIYPGPRLQRLARSGQGVGAGLGQEWRGRLKFGQATARVDGLTG